MIIDLDGFSHFTDAFNVSMREKSKLGEEFSLGGSHEIGFLDV